MITLDRNSKIHIFMINVFNTVQTLIYFDTNRYYKMNTYTPINMTILY